MFLCFDTFSVIHKLSSQLMARPSLIFFCLSLLMNSGSVQRNIASPSNVPYFVSLSTSGHSLFHSLSRCALRLHRRRAIFASSRRRSRRRKTLWRWPRPDCTSVPTDPMSSCVGTRCSTSTYKHCSHDSILFAYKYVSLPGGATDIDYFTLVTWTIIHKNVLVLSTDLLVSD